MKSVLNIHWKDWCWSSNSLATWYEELTHWKRPWCWERSKAGGEGDDRGWDGWMASSTWWTWAWASSRSWWWTGNPGVLQSMGSQRVGHHWATELNWSSRANQFTPSLILSITWYTISPFEEIVGSINNKIRSLLCCYIRFIPKVILWLEYSQGYQKESSGGITLWVSKYPNLPGYFITPECYSKWSLFLLG